MMIQSPVALFLLLSATIGQEVGVLAFSTSGSSTIAQSRLHNDKHGRRRLTSGGNNPVARTHVSSTARFAGLEEPSTSFENDLGRSAAVNSTSAKILESEENKRKDLDLTMKVISSRWGDGGAAERKEASKGAKSLESGHFLSRIDGVAYTVYLCNVLAVNLPIILLPFAATEHLSAVKGVSIAATVAGVASVATLGGAVGKFTNGFICQRWGSYTCSKLYLIGMALCSLAFSFAPNPTVLGLAYAGMEFCASIQWTSLAVMLTNYYSKSPAKKLAAALTAMGLASTSGAIAAKTFGPALVSTFDWKTVARVGSLIALFGSWMASKAPIQQFQKEDLKRHKEAAAAKPVGSWLITAKGSLQALLTSKLFCLLAVAHSMAFVIRGIDRIMGTFVSEVTGLPHAISGGLTLSTTLGLLMGLVSASKVFPGLTIAGQKKFLTKRYITNIAAACGLTAVATIFSGGGEALPSLAAKAGVAAAVALFSALLSANVSFQFYQMPTYVAKLYQDHKEVCISWLDGIGFLFSAPVFAATAKIVPNYGWGATWAMLTVLFAGAWTLMMNSLTPVLEKQKETPAAA